LHPLRTPLVCPTPPPARSALVRSALVSLAHWPPRCYRLLHHTVIYATSPPSRPESGAAGPEHLLPV
jgi:hypothetical protein